MPLDFTPTPHQTGHAIGFAIRTLSQQLSAVDEDWLREASVSADQFKAELLLLSAAAAMDAIETAGLNPEQESGVAGGFFAWVKELRPLERDLLLENLDNATDDYAEAARADVEHPPTLAETGALEAAFGQRLLELGDCSEARKAACARLCIAVPKVLWPAQQASVAQMLGDASLIRTQ